MCGGNLNINKDVSTAECEYCGSVQTVPKVDNEKKLTLFARANRLRAACEFDKAAGIYEAIIADFSEEAEAYWGLILCKYGIEYVDDPATGKKIPTCHRSSFDSIMDDNDLELVLENADAMARKLYREEAKQIEELRKGIIAVSAKEAPYDIFICYKETDETGNRTLDSVLAQDVYDALTDKGYRVFFSRITLEDKLGMEYEPYIFAALNSAKIMLAFGTDYEYFNAVWVKNEWSRFLKLMAKDKEKHLIPCYKGIDAYDMPKEFARLQAQDLGKMGAIQDIVRGVQKLLPKQEQTVKETVVVQQATGSNPTVESYLKRMFIFLEDGDWNSADEYSEKVLDIDPENACAYLGKLMAERKIHKREALQEQTQPLDGSNNYQKAIRFADDTLKAELQGYSAQIQARIRAETAAHEKQEEEKSQLRKKLQPAQQMIAAGQYHSVGLKADGTAVAVGDSMYKQCKVSGWRDIVAIAAGSDHTVGLKADGTVVAMGDNLSKQCKVSDWRDIVAISAGHWFTLGLKADGTAVSVGYNSDRRCDVTGWKDIVAISAGVLLTLGLKADGTVVAVGENQYGECKVSEWNNIVAISAGRGYAVGLKADGTVVAVGENDDGQCNVESWRDIVAISTKRFHTVGLKADGTVVATGMKKYGQCNVEGWRDIVAISAGMQHTLGLKADGTVVVAGEIKRRRCNVTDWKLFQNYDSIEEEQNAARKTQTKPADAAPVLQATHQAAEQLVQTKPNAAMHIPQAKPEPSTEIVALWRRKGLCKHCGGELKGIITTKRCATCGKPKDY